MEIQSEAAAKSVNTPKGEDQADQGFQNDCELGRAQVCSTSWMHHASAILVPIDVPSPCI